ncbi:hypothetical protein [Flavobacterium laiguense]|uniref:Uncharacterized protein n=1 Tax=Flavobacterium laiguense TaxID=2169409 RepID=A0A2U1JXI7_9FLAO|nr:hypothetical protein [Flavobacterium laiguense]PWA09518.1 hypothetical protein DB891_07495 [Flavobacterium laiguense]
MLKSNPVVLITKEDVSVKVENVTTMEVFNVGDVDCTFNNTILKAGKNKTLVVADGTYSDVDIDVVFSTKALTGYEKKIEIIYKKIIPPCVN